MAKDKPPRKRLIAPDSDDEASAEAEGAPAEATKEPEEGEDLAAEEEVLEGEVDFKSIAARLGTNLRTLHQSLAAVAEFKGEAYGHGAIVGVARFVQVDEETLLVEGKLGGLEPDARYRVSVRSYGDVTRGIESVGGVYPEGGDLGVVVADANGDATVPSRVVDGRLKAWDIIGRSVAIEPEPESKDAGKARGAAAVLARSSGGGDNLKQQCACDGTVIWESTPDDFKPEKK